MKFSGIVINTSTHTFTTTAAEVEALVRIYQHDPIESILSPRATARLGSLSNEDGDADDDGKEP